MFKPSRSYVVVVVVVVVVGGVVTFDLPMLTFDLPMLTFDLPKRSVLQKEANLGRSKVTTFHGKW